MYFAKLGLFIALILLNVSVVFLLSGYAKNIEHLVSIAKNMFYSAVLLMIISAMAFVS